MKDKLSLLLLLPISLILTACSFSIPRLPGRAVTPTEAAVPPQAQATPAAEICPVPEGVEVKASADGIQPVAIKGSFEYTNDIITTYYVEQAVALMDLYGFVIRDQEWEMPVSSQTLGFLDIDTDRHVGAYSLQLPAEPSATLVDVAPNGKDDTGVQVFSIGYFPNLTDGPYSEGDDPSYGWPTYLASTRTDSENNDEINGGKLVIWSPDDNQFFPSSFGEDGLLFTEDDPVMPVPRGYSVIDLDQQPFAIIRDKEPELVLYEPSDAAIKDFSNQSYTKAFKNMFEIVRKEYAFNGIEGKQPDWDRLYADVFPKIEAAEKQRNPEQFFLAMRQFVVAFKDGHVGLDGGSIEARILNKNTAGGYGFAIRQLDDGRIIVVYILDGGPAAKVGMKPGAVVTQFNGQPIDKAIAAVDPPTAPHSTEFSLRYQQARYLLRAPLGTTASVTFTNPGEDEKTVKLKNIDERQSLTFTSTFRGFDPNALPVEQYIISANTGYIKLNTNYDDLNLIIRLFKRALQTFADNGLDTLILDLRQNSGGAPLGLAGFLTDQEIVLGQKEYYSELTGEFEPDGMPERILPNREQYRFKSMYLMVDQACASACELEAYGFSKVPGMKVVGQYPSAGVEAEVSRGQFLLPEGMSLQIPTGRFTLPDGSIFLEGQGVQPTIRIPITEEFVLSSGDPVLSYVIGLTIK